MKKYMFLIIALISIAFSACDLNGSTNNTPQISFVTAPKLNANDSLNMYITDVAGTYRMDTISVGDTVGFPILLNGFSNHLTSYYLTQSDTTVAQIILPGKNSLDSIFLSSPSNYSSGKFIFRSNIYNLFFPFKYVALKPSNDVTLSFSLSSDANFEGNMVSGTNSVSFVLKTPIKVAKSSTVSN